MIIVLMGKSGSGKTTVRDALVEHGFDRIITCTTRKPRENEKDYIFLSEEEFKNKINNNEFLEYDFFNGYYYGSLQKDYTGNKVIVMTPNGYRNIKDRISCVSVYLEASIDTLKNRLLLFRKEDEQKIYKRLEEDQKQFQDLEADICIKVDQQSIESIVLEILERVYGKV